MKKGIVKMILAVLCSFVFVFGLAACDSGNDNNNTAVLTYRVGLGGDIKKSNGFSRCSFSHYCRLTNLPPVP